MSFAGVSESLPTGSPEISPQGLVLAYDMGTLTPQGTLKDFSRHRNTGRVVGTEVVRGPFGPARRFKSAEDCVRLPSRRSLHVRGPLSIAAWVRFSELGQHQHIVAYDDLYCLWMDGQDRLRFADTRGGAFESDPSPIPAATWCSLVGTFDGRPGTALNGGNIALYVNGRPIPGRAIGVWNPGRPVEGFVGKESHDGQFHLPFLGDIAAVLIFRRRLSAAEALAFSAAVPFPRGVDSPIAGSGPDLEEIRPGATAYRDPPLARGGSRSYTKPSPRTIVTPHVVRITNMIPPYGLRTQEILQRCPQILFETWLMTDGERNRNWSVPSSPYVRVFRDLGLDLTRRDMFALHFNPGMIRELSRRPPNLVLLGGYEQPTCVAAGILLDGMGIPFILNSESISLSDSPLGCWAPFAVRELIRRSAGVIVPGEASRTHFLDLGVPSDRIFLAPRVVDDTRFVPPASANEKAEARALLGMRGRTVCLYVGRLTEMKGISELLEAFRVLRPRERGLTLHIVGEGLLRPWVESHVSSDPELCDTVSLAGYVPDNVLSRYYMAADIFVFPTRRDVWGLVLNEAMSAGLAVVASDAAGATRDLVDDGVHGSVVPPRSPRHLSEAVLRLHEDPGLRERMGQAARQRVLDGYTPRHQAMGILRAIMTTLHRLGRVDAGPEVFENAWAHET